MCKHQNRPAQEMQYDIRENKTNKDTMSTSSSTTPLSPTPSSPISVGCGVDRSIPTSVTSLPSRVVRLDQYQIGSIRNRVFDDDARDDDFEWYDLDTIHEDYEYSTTVSHNARAGLVFTSERQRIKRQATCNRLVDPSVMEQIRDKNNGPATFIISWIHNIGGNSNHSKNSFSSSSESTQSDRELEEQIQSLEQELYDHNQIGDSYRGDEDGSTSLNESFSSLY